MATFGHLELEANNQRGGKPAIPSIAAKHAEHCPSTLKNSALGSLTQTFILKTNTSLHLHFAFTDQILGKTPLSPQCRAGAHCSVAAGSLSPFACLWQPMCCTAAASSPLRAAVPRHSPLCCHAGDSAAATCIQAATPGIALGDCLPQETEGLRGYKGTSHQFKGLHGLQFVLLMVHQEVRQETSVY